jgi:hypothetical protein
MECEWCHENVSEGTLRTITRGHPLAKRFDDERFMVMLGKVNEDWFAEHRAS